MGGPCQRVEASDGIIDPTTAAHIKCGALRGRNGETVELLYFLFKQQVCPGNDASRCSGVAPDQLDWGVIVNPLRSV